jgi:hypothetical protein
VPGLGPAREELAAAVTAESPVAANAVANQAPERFQGLLAADFPRKPHDSGSSQALHVPYFTGKKLKPSARPLRVPKTATFGLEVPMQ